VGKNSIFSKFKVFSEKSEVFAISKFIVNSVGGKNSNLSKFLFLANNSIFDKKLNF